MTKTKTKQAVVADAVKSAVKSAGFAKMSLERKLAHVAHELGGVVDCSVHLSSQGEVYWNAGHRSARGYGRTATEAIADALVEQAKNHGEQAARNLTASNKARALAAELGVVV